MPPMRVEALSGISLLVISQLQLHFVAACSPAFSRRFALLSLAFSASVALCTILELCSRRLYQRDRTAVVLVVRLAATAAVAAPHIFPEPAAASCGPASVLSWVLNSHALTATFLSIGFPLRFGVHLWAAVLQQCMLAACAINRCAGAPGAGVPAGASFLDHYPPSCFAGMAWILDWPFHMVAPGLLDGPGKLSPAAACLACTLWLQLVLGLLVPTVLLALKASDEAERRRLPLRLVLLALDDMPWVVTAFAAQLLWLLLHGAATRL